MNTANVVHTLDATILRKVRKPGLYDRQITAQKDAVLGKMIGKKAYKRDLMTALYGGRKGKHIAMILSRLDTPLACHQRAHSFTEQGDFTNCFRRGI